MGLCAPASLIFGWPDPRDLPQLDQLPVVIHQARRPDEPVRADKDREWHDPHVVLPVQPGRPSHHPDRLKPKLPKQLSGPVTRSSGHDHDLKPGDAAQLPQPVNDRRKRPERVIGEHDQLERAASWRRPVTLAVTIRERPDWSAPPARDTVTLKRA
jgi:hypothetical protein